LKDGGGGIRTHNSLARTAVLKTAVYADSTTPPFCERYCKGVLPVCAEETADIRVFKETLGRVLQVPKSDVKELLAKEKAANADKPKRGPKPTDRK
jgi:hypothetical protein